MLKKKHSKLGKNLSLYHNKVTLSSNRLNVLQAAHSRLETSNKTPFHQKFLTY